MLHPQPKSCLALNFRQRIVVLECEHPYTSFPGSLIFQRGWEYERPWKRSWCVSSNLRRWLSKRSTCFVSRIIGLKQSCLFSFQISPAFQSVLHSFRVPPLHKVYKLCLTEITEEGELKSKERERETTCYKGGRNKDVTDTVCDN